MNEPDGQAAIRVAAAPVSWGVSELQELPEDMTPELILDQMVAAGYTGSELGPPGFLGDGATTRARLATRGLELVGAFLPLRFSRPEHGDADRAWMTGVLDLLDEATPGPVRPKAILADASIEPDRLALAGRISAYPETWLKAARFRALIDGLHRAAEVCQRRGYEAVLHPHAGSYVESDREVRSVADKLDPALLGLCLDTGHIAFGGADPAAIARDYRPLVRHVHLKDLDRAVFERVTGEGGDLSALLRHGVFAELGAGSAGTEQVVRTLQESEYRGWIVVEQDRVLTAADTPAELLAAQDRNRRFLARLGL